ncbi:uncharacterized protein MAL13P1.304 isoform X2 [Sitodiplosis mosellana]|uniref:uncharacterized protein MAL13P1.304 isoform X2 n=1 Tax=Sitodiplosis mosellana TaxID=263140 RepID=UPI002444CE37|nr:uncharacterized protein MAL13P1.304 isoform X2 [Sitodiplosis mosellana]
MQEKFAIRAAATTTSNKQTGQIDVSISKYDEMLYIPKSIEKLPTATERYVQYVNEIGGDVACEPASDFNGSTHDHRSRNRPSNDGTDDESVVLKYTKHSQRGFTKVFITLIVLCLWPWLWPFGDGGSGSVGFVHCDSSVNGFANASFSSTTIEPIKWLLASSTATPTPTPSMTNRTEKAHDTQSQSAALLLISNVSNTYDKRSENNLDANHAVVDSSGSISSYERRKQQQRISIIKTRSKKTNPNASFSLDLFRQQEQEPNSTSGRVQNMQSNHTLNRLDVHDTNRIPDVMSVRESLHHHYHHHHHSVIKRFRAFVTKRYHFSATQTKDNTNMRRFHTLSLATRTLKPMRPTTMPNDRQQPIEEPPASLKHILYVLSSIDDDDDNDHQSQKLATRGIHKITRRYATATTDEPNLNTDTILTSINRTNVLLRDLHKKHFDLHAGQINGANAMKSHSISVAAAAAAAHPSKRKRSIDLQLEHQHQHQQSSAKPTTTQPFDDHFFNSKLKNYYFLYQLDNISNYNNHFDLLNSPSNATTTQIQINKQRIQFSNHRQIDNAPALSHADATESDIPKYNNPQSSATLNFTNNHSNHIKRILLAKIASVCLNCVEGTSSSITTPDSQAAGDDNDNDGNGVDVNDPSSVRIYVLPRSLRSTVTATESGHQKLFRFFNASISDRTNNNNDDIEWNESMLQQSLKNYPRIAGLLGNLSLAKIPNQFNSRQNPNLHSNDDEILQNIIIDSSDTEAGSNNVSHAMVAVKTTAATTTTAAKLFMRHDNFNSIFLSKSSLKTNNNLTKTTNDVVKKVTTTKTTPIQADTHAAKHISINNYSPISTFEHYIRIISSRNINNRKNYYAIQTNGNKSKSLNFQQQPKQHSTPAKFQRVKKQKQFIQLFATNHRFILNNDTMNDNNNDMHGMNDENDNNSATISTSMIADGGAIDGHNATDARNIVKNYKLNFTLNENNCTIKVLNFDQVNANNVKNQSQQQQQQQSNNTVATAAIDNDVAKEKRMQFDSKIPLTIEKQSNVNRITAESMIRISNHGKSNRKVKKNVNGSANEASLSSRSSTNALNSYLMRLESIKYQILMKLGLKQKPNITTTLPNHVIMNTLYRGDDNTLPQSNENPGRRGHHRKQHGQKQRHKQKQMQKQKHQSKLNKNVKHKLMPAIQLNDDPNQQVYQFERPHFSGNDRNDNRSRSSNSDEEKFPFAADIFAEETNDIESDDFYGRTREIIIFAEKDESDNSNSARSDAISQSAQLNHTSAASSLSSSSPLHQTNNSSDNKLKQRTKCKGDIIANRQVRKRKRRRRQVDHQSMDAKQIAQSKSVILGSHEMRIREELVKSSASSSASQSATSTMEQTQYQQSNTDFNSDTRVRRAFLWIKVDELAPKINNKKKNVTKHHKAKGKHRHRTNNHRNFFRLWVFRIDEPTSEPNQHIKLSASKSVHVSRLGWQKLDVTSTVRQWYANGGKSRLRFLVDCSGCADRIKIHLFDGKPTKNAKARAKPNLLRNDKLNGSLDPVRPFLVIYTDPHVMKRVRRHTPDCSMAARGQCCKQKFYVSFAELGWEDWIIAPHGYYANYCQGNCNGMRTPDNFRSYHSHVIEEYRKMNRLTGLQPCCTPLKFSSMSLIYYEENQKIIKRDLPKMVVEECGCP